MSNKNVVAEDQLSHKHKSFGEGLQMVLYLPCPLT